MGWTRRIDGFETELSKIAMGTGWILNVANLEGTMDGMLGDLRYP